MPDEDIRLALRTADQLRTDIANLECGQEFLMDQIAGLPSRRELARMAVVIMFATAVLGIALMITFAAAIGLLGIGTFLRLPACSWN